MVQHLGISVEDLGSSLHFLVGVRVVLEWRDQVKGDQGHIVFA